jgi:hypothetical protein
VVEAAGTPDLVALVGGTASREPLDWLGGLASGTSCVGVWNT